MQENKVKTRPIISSELVERIAENLYYNVPIYNEGISDAYTWEELPEFPGTFSHIKSNCLSRTQNVLDAIERLGYCIIQKENNK